MRWSARNVLIGFAIASVLGACTGVILLPVFAVRMLESKIGPVHSFPVAVRPRFLTDDLALSKAREALATDGYDLGAWSPHEDRRTKAPDGAADLYLARNQINTDAGYIMFVNPASRISSRIVEVELKADTAECRVIIPK
jgi:hypothetical protein